MEQAHTELHIQTPTKGLTDITRVVSDWMEHQGIHSGLLTLFIKHTSASLTIQENADPDVLLDLESFFARLVLDQPNLYRHTAEGPDDMPAHIRSALTDVSLVIPVCEYQPVLGTWQGIYVFEHRSHPHIRKVHLTLMGR